MDNNLSSANLDITRDFIKEEQNRGEKVAPNIYISRLTGDTTAYYTSDSKSIVCKPIVYVSGEYTDAYYGNTGNVLFHENSHYLDDIKEDSGYKTNANCFKKHSELSNIVARYISDYATTDRNEFIAEFRTAVVTGKIEKYKKPNGEIIYREVNSINNKLTEENRLQKTNNLREEMSSF